MNLSPAWRRHFRAWHDSKAIFLLLLLVPAAVHAQAAGGSPFDTGFSAMQNLFTGTVAKVASLIAIVVGGYQVAHGAYWEQSSVVKFWQLGEADAPQPTAGDETPSEDISGDNALDNGMPLP